MNLVDSSGWLEYFIDGPNADYFAPALKKTSTLLVSPINLYEVYKKVASFQGQSQALKVISIMEKAKLAPINTSIALKAARLSTQHRLAMADSLILATAYFHQATLWTQDKDFKGLEGVCWKEAS